ncbi:unnamed protein product, partial [Mesorhabditis spiculigera]
MTAGKPIKCRAAILWKVNEPLKVEDVEVAPPEADEVRVKIIYNALCHSDLHVMDGSSKNRLPIVLGHEAAGVVESVGSQVHGFAEGDVVIPLYLPQCRKCRSCLRGDNNSCERIQYWTEETAITCKGQKITAFMGLGTFSEYTVIKEFRLAKISPGACLEKACLAGCGLATGYGAAVNTAQVRPGDRVAVFGLGGVGLSAIQGAKNAGAAKIYAVDINESKFDAAKAMGATDFVNPKHVPEGGRFSQWFIEKHGAVDKTIECIGNVNVMKDAVEIVERGWGRVTIIGVAAAGHELALNPGHFLTGKTISGSLFGGWRSVDQVPGLVDDITSGKINVDPLITHRFPLERVEEAVELLKSGKSIRSVIALSKL